MARKRERGLPHETNVHLGDLYITIGSTRTKVLTYTYNAEGLLRPYAWLQRCEDSLHPGPPYLSGGPLSLWSYTDDCLTPQHWGQHLSTWKYDYVGGFVCGARPSLVFGVSDFENLGHEDFSQASFGDVTSFGATGWNKFAPGKASADLGVFLAELRDLPRMLKGTANAFHDTWRAMGGSRSGFTPKKVADHWLNTQFGWLPFINDMRKFYNTQKKLERILDYIQRNNGHWVRRGGTVRQVQDSDVIYESDTVSAHLPTLTSQFYADPQAPGSQRRTRLTSERVWFEGKFRYWIPRIGTPKWRRNTVRQLFGGTISPSVLWEATPWSWLVDWFSNAGDVYANMNTGWAENLAAKYAFVMGTTEKSVVVDSTLRMNGGPLTHTWEFGYHRKHRVPANPFGFGLTWDDLSARQLSILGALGVSRSRPPGG